jgi:predicted nucleic acid-binding protein
MILVDTGVLIDFLRTKDPKLDQLFRTEPVAVCGVTRAEILAGSRNAGDRQRLLQFLARFHPVPRGTNKKGTGPISGDRPPGAAH